MLKNMDDWPRSSSDVQLVVLGNGKKYFDEAMECESRDKSRKLRIIFSHDYVRISCNFVCNVIG